MGYSFMSGCLRASDVLSQAQNCQAIVTDLLGETEESVVTSCINDPNLNVNKTGYMRELMYWVSAMQKAGSNSARARDNDEINKYNALVQKSQQLNQQVEQQWDALPQEAETQSNTLATDEQQTISQAQSIISSMSTLCSLLQSM